MSSTDKFSTDWVEGFAKEAAALGLNAEDAKALLKSASLYDLSSDENFVAGFNETAEKEAGLGGWLGGALTAGGLAAVPWLYNKISPYFNQSAEMRKHQQNLEGMKGPELGKYMSDYAMNKQRSTANNFRSGRREMKGIYSDDNNRRAGGWGSWH